MVQQLTTCTTADNLAVATADSLTAELSAAVADRSACTAVA